ncbi:MAG: hypothetical protein H2212_07325 [Ruminococcus sp.]|nr:hypothetical protein [Ruminococcus sp.]
MEACQLKMVDEDYRIHQQAWLNFSAQAEKSAGKGKSRPVYDRFEKFFDYEKALSRLQKSSNKSKERFAGIGKLLKKGGD